jgi:hypothetical protein
MKIKPGDLVRHYCSESSPADHTDLFLVIDDKPTSVTGQSLIQIWNMKNKKIGWDFAYGYRKVKNDL